MTHGEVLEGVEDGDVESQFHYPVGKVLDGVLQAWHGQRYSEQKFELEGAGEGGVRQ